jgi:putative transposase
MDQRVEFLATVRAGHISVTEACDRFGISRKTGYKWMNRYDEFGVRGLEELSRSPKSHPHAVSAQVVEQLLSARRRHPHWGARTLVQWLENQGAVGLPAPSTVTDVLRRHGLVKARPRRSGTKRAVVAPQPDFDAPNRTWCADFKGQFQLRDRSWCYPLTVTDGFSRLLLCCRGLGRISVEPTKRLFEGCFAQYGVPAAILTDNGMPFASTALGGLSRLSVWWLKLGIRLHRIVPGRPQQNGRHERMHRTLKQETIDAPALNLRAQQRLLDNFRHEYNCERPHAALNGRPPTDLYVPSPRRMPSRLESPAYPGHQAVRSVRDDGAIKFQGQSVFVSRALAREPVGLEEFDADRYLLRFANVELAVLDCRASTITIHKLPAPQPPLPQPTDSP